MSRIIKFRVWDKKFGMMYGDGISVQGDGTFYLERADHDGNGIEIAESEHGELVLMQFTGLYDKKGKEIYEGDVVRKMMDGEPDRLIEQLVMKWEPEQWTEEGYMTGFSQLWTSADQYEVIGNIHENPELLKT